jgi:hypothetical protein
MKHIFLFIIFVLCITGCTNNISPKTVPASGTLTQNGKPLTDIRVEFSKIDTGSLSFAETDEQGHFTLMHTHGKKGAEPGKYRVSVFRKSKPIPFPPGQPAPSAPPMMTPEVPITMSNKTPIEIEVTEKGLNEFIIDLK